MTPKELEQTYTKLVAKYKKAGEALRDFRISVKKICHHPEIASHKYTSHEDHDDGYGRWWVVKHSVVMCKICGHEVRTRI